MDLGGGRQNFNSNHPTSINRVNILCNNQCNASKTGTAMMMIRVNPSQNNYSCDSKDMRISHKQKFGTLLDLQKIEHFEGRTDYYAPCYYFTPQKLKPENVSTTKNTNANNTSTEGNRHGYRNEVVPQNANSISSQNANAGSAFY